MCSLSFLSENEPNNPNLLVLLRSERSQLKLFQLSLAKYSFRVKSEQLSVAYTLTATDEHDKKQWLTSLQESISKCQSSQLPDAVAQPTVIVESSSGSKTKESRKKKQLRRSSSSKSDSDKSCDSRESSSLPRMKPKKLAQKLSKMSSSRNNRKSANDDEKSNDFLVVSDSVFDDGKTCRRSRSLTTSPVSLFNSWNGRKRISGQSLTRSDSGTTKPPSGKPSRTARSSTSKSPIPSPSRGLVTTRSTPDLFNVISRKPFSKVKSDHDLSLPDTIVTIFNDDVDGFDNDFPSLSEPYRPGISHLIIDSPDHPAASDTSQNFPILEEDSITPVLKSFSSIHSSLSSPSVSVSIPGAGPMLPWQSLEDGRKMSEDLEVSSQVSSSASFVDAPLAMDDVDFILESAETDDADSGDVAFSFCFSSTASREDVSETVKDLLDDVLNRVCDAIPVSHFGDCAPISRNESFITIKSDDGSPWRGDSLEISA